MSLEAGDHLTWRWINVEVPASEFSTYSPAFRYQNREWFLECRGSSDGVDLVIQLNLLSFTHPLPPQRQSSFEVSLRVFRGRDNLNVNRAMDVYGVIDAPGTKILWQEKASRMEQFFPVSSGDRVLSFRIQFREGNLQRDVVLPHAYLNAPRQQQAIPLQMFARAQRARGPKTFADASVQTSLTADSISCLDALSADIGKMLVEESGADLEIECDGHTTRAHKGVLCSRSPVFAGMLQSDMLERKTGMINVQDVDVDTFRKLINFLYTGKLDDAMTHEATVSLYEAADMYGVETLSRSCSHLLIQNLTVDNACNLLAVADAHGDEDLKRMITPYILEEKIPQSGECWQAFCKSHPSLANEVYGQYVDYISSEGPSKKRCARTC